jgi:cellobionic acid phosphorylase
LRGDAAGLAIAPSLPAGWDGMQVERSFRGAQFKLNIRRAAVDAVEVWQDGHRLPQARVDGVAAGQRYELDVLVPR